MPQGEQELGIQESQELPEISLEENTQALNRLLDQLEAASTVEKQRNAAGGVIQRDKGTRFETLIRDWLAKDPVYSDNFTKVQTYAQWAQEHPGLATNSKDIGIDLVATNAKENEETDVESYTAIQCKFYKADARVSKAGVDSFLSASNKKYFTKRFIVATNSRWTDNVKSELESCVPPVTLLTRDTLAHSTIRWDQYLKQGIVGMRKRTPREYQKVAIQKVKDGFKTADRGKLIMACGTGKTYTSLKTAEDLQGKGGLVLFLVPSLSLLSQTLRDWKQQCIFKINAFAVCSDTSTGKVDLEDVENLTSVGELNYPATTNADKLASEVNKCLSSKDAMTVVFSTYQSLEVIHKAQNQKNHPLPSFGLVICDEAHRTAGGHYVDEEESFFTRIHKNDYIKADKRLYMTATPKIYGRDAKKQQEDCEIELYSMDDESVFGKTFHTINFTDAVMLGALVDYKVIVLTVSESLLTGSNEPNADEAAGWQYGAAGGLSVSHAAKVVGTWKALSKIDLQKEVSMGQDLHAMKRAVGFAQVIRPSDKYDRISSMDFAEKFQSTIETFKKKTIEVHRAEESFDEAQFNAQNSLSVETRHIDGSMDATEKDNLLNWLREEPEANQCKILFNVRCLSEGVDVPSLDAVIFLSPRKSQVDVVQTVGRVMRTAKGKERGYVIIPIVTPAGTPADMVLDNNKDFETVWQILRALKSIDNNFGAMVDGQLGTVNSEKLEVICLTNQPIKRKNTRTARKTKVTKTPGTKKVKGNEADKQMAFAFENDEFLEEKIKSRIVKKVGNRREWADWAEDVGVICQNQIKHIGAVLDNPENVKSIQAFEEFSEELKATLNGELTKEAIVEMLGQHVVTKPIIDALFADYPFTEKNPISQAMTSMMDALDKDGMQTATQLLKGFYEAVQLRTKNIKTGADRQTVILELFDKFFSAAFPKMRDKLGIVYTPVEIVDFINQSVADLLKKEFGMNISDEGVHILDPFVGTGTFMTRLLQSGLIPKEKLQEKFDHDLHAHEIVPLAYYIASMNLESTLHDLVPTSEYKPNNVMVWTDTFADNHVEEDFFHTSLGANNKRLAENQKLDIRIIIGNPPYSVGQASANDDNANEHYALLDQRIAETYAAQTEATNKNSLYDSYIRGYRWAADRIKNKGIIGFVTNAGWIESNSADGLRKCMAEEFNSIYIYHLKGNQRTSGEISRREGGKIFGEGSRAPIAIVLLVKNPASQEKGKIYFKAVDDYLTREQKLMQVRSDKSILSLNFEVITPDSHGDWLNQRNNDFSKFIRIDGKKTEEKSLFANYSRGLSTARDPWVYNSSSIQLYGNIKRMFDIYLKQLGDYEKNPDTFSFIRDEKRIHWNRTLENYFKRFNKPVVDKSKTTIALYRPFVKQYCYFDKFANDMTYQLPLLFNDGKASNLVICINQNAKTDAGQIALMTNTIPDLHFNGDSQCFPRWLSSEPQSASDLFVAGSNKIIQHDAITDCALNDFQLAYKDDLLTKDDIFYYVYGVLHSKEYRSLFANNLSKELPRIPRVATYSDFKKFEIAGRKLADLHVNYESVTPYAGLKIEMKAGASFRVTQMRYGKLAGRTGNAAKDRTRVIYNEDISIDNIPIEAHEYIVNKKSALDWIVERCCVSIDKQSGIVNDFNLYGEELGNSRYIFDLIPRIITVSLETMKIVKSLPKLEIHPLDK